MRATPLVVLVVLACGAVWGCGSEESQRGGDDAGSDAISAMRRTIALSAGDTIAVKTSAADGISVVVTIRAGKEDAGSYTSSSSSLEDAALDAREGLPDPNAEVTMTVDASGNIHSIASKVTKR